MLTRNCRILTNGVVIAITALVLTMTGCGSSGYPAQSVSGSQNGTGAPTAGNSLTGGNWSLVSTAAASSDQPYILGGSIQQNGTSLSGKMHVLGPCEDPQAKDPNISVPVTGSVVGNEFTLTTGPTIAGSVINVTLTGSGSSLQNLTGTFTVSGSCGTSNQGTIAAALVPTISSTWAGPGLTVSGHSGVIVWLGLKQQDTPDEFGTYALTGLVTYINSSCEANSVPIFGYIAGSMVFVGVDESDTNPVIFSFSGALAPPFDAPPVNSVLAGDYQTLDGGSLSSCAGDKGTTALDYQY
jgi:hypothetical protein